MNAENPQNAAVAYPFFRPAMQAGHDLRKSMAKPIFSGRPHDYAAFEASWNQATGIVQAASPLGWNEHLMLQEFHNCLDPASKIRLDAWRKENPALKLSEFKRELRGQFGVDSQRQYRRDWE